MSTSTTTQAPQALKPVRMSPGRWMKTVGWRHIILMLGVAFALFPISYIINLATSQGSTLTSACPLNLQGWQTIQCILPLPPFDTGNFEAVLSNPQRPFAVWFRNTMIIATVVSFTSVFMGASAAFAFSRMRFRGRRGGLTSLILIQMFPSILAITAVFLLLSKIRDTFPNIGLGTIGGLILIYLGGTLGVNTYLMKGFFDTIPVEIDESARIDGASHVRIFFGMILRLSVPVLTVVFFVTFTGMFNELAIASVVLADQRNTTLAVGLYSFVSNPLRQEWGLFAAGALMAAIPMLVVFAFAQRSLVTGLTAGSVKG